MCIAILKRAGLALPSEEVLRNCFEGNSDGAGIAWAKDGKVHYVKGLQTWEQFLARLSEAKELLAGGTEYPMTMHFRIGTHGSKNNPVHTHPFPLVDNYETMMLLEAECPAVVVHNGIIKTTFGVVRSTYYTGKKYNTETRLYEDDPDYKPEPSDTMEYIKEVLYPLSTVPGWMEHHGLTGLATQLLGPANRLAILNGEGDFFKFGEWVEEDGIFYSNTSFRVKKVMTTSKPKDIEIVVGAASETIAARHTDPGTRAVFDYPHAGAGYTRASSSGAVVIRDFSSYALVKSPYSPARRINESRWETYAYGYDTIKKLMSRNTYGRSAKFVSAKNARTITAFLEWFTTSVCERQDILRAVQGDVPFYDSELKYRIFYTPVVAEILDDTTQKVRTEEILDPWVPYWTDDKEEYLYMVDLLQGKSRRIGKIIQRDFNPNLQTEALDWEEYQSCYDSMQEFIEDVEIFRKNQENRRARTYQETGK